MTSHKFSILLSPAAYGALRGASIAAEPEDLRAACRGIRVSFDEPDSDHPNCRQITFAGTDTHIIAVLMAPLEGFPGCSSSEELRSGLTPIAEIPQDALKHHFLPAEWVRKCFPVSGRWARLEFEGSDATGMTCKATIFGGVRKVRKLKMTEASMIDGFWPDESRVLPTEDQLSAHYEKPSYMSAFVLPKFSGVAEALMKASGSHYSVAFAIRTVGNHIHAYVESRVSEGTDPSYDRLDGRVYAMGMRL